MAGYVRSIAILEVKIPDDDLKQNLRFRLPGLEISVLRRAKDSLTQILRDEKQGIQSLLLLLLLNSYPDLSPRRYAGSNYLVSMHGYVHT
jgi:hypothetical protein